MLILDYALLFFIPMIQVLQKAYPLFDKSIFLVPNGICKVIKVSGADYGTCSGIYTLFEEHAPWAPEKPVYKHVSQDRYINFHPSGTGWQITDKHNGKGGFHRGKSKYNAAFS